MPFITLHVRIRPAISNFLTSATNTCIMGYTAVNTWHEVEFKPLLVCKLLQCFLCQWRLLVIIIAKVFLCLPEPWKSGNLAYETCSTLISFAIAYLTSIKAGLSHHHSHWQCLGHRARLSSLFSNLHCCYPILHQ